MIFTQVKDKISKIKKTGWYGGKTWTYDLQKQYYKWEFGLGRRLTILKLLDKDIWILHFAKTLLSARGYFQYLFCFAYARSAHRRLHLRCVFQRLMATKLWWHDTCLVQTVHGPDTCVTG